MTDRLNLQQFVNLAQPDLGAQVLYATDDFFAEKEGLLKQEPPVFIEDKFTERGKWMDGWESRRRRTPGHDYCIIRICRGRIYGFDVDTSHFTGNYPEHVSIDACDCMSEPDDSTVWEEVVPKSSLEGDSSNVFMVRSEQNWNYLRLNIYPDGGVARLRVYGEVHKVWDLVGEDEETDFASVHNGGVAVACSDMHFGNMWNLLKPGRAINMGDGWETRRRRGEGFDWAIIKLGHPAVVGRIEVDTLHFKGNYPARCAVRGIFAPGASQEYLANNSDHWMTLLPDAALQADKSHEFKKDIKQTGDVTHLKLEIYPDGGVGRFRAFGTKSMSGSRVLVPQPLTAESFEAYGDVIETTDRPSRAINHGYADRYEHLAHLDITDGGRPALSIFRAKPLPMPLRISKMERHPNASQAFIPRGAGRFLIAVAKSSDDFDLNELKVFVTNGQQGVNYARGVWHHFLMVLREEQEFVVIDRSDPDDNTQEIELDSPYPIIDESALEQLEQS
ncbi:MAG: allantoicase [Acidiferrobacterales bacterium]|nr:allantoicase [Acidiferrobacterales bacterium]